MTLDIASPLPAMVLLLAAFLGGARPVKSKRQVASGLAHMGHGLFQLFLAAGLADIVHLCTGASPAAASGWSAFIAMVAFAAFLPLVLGGWLSLAILGPLQMAGYEWPDMIRKPFWAGGFSGFWGRWMAAADEATRSRWQLPVMAAAAVLAASLLVLKNPPHTGHALWLGWQTGLIALSPWLASVRLWQKLPHGVRCALVTALYALSMPLLYTEGPVAAWGEWVRLFNPPAETLYTVFLDGRLTTARVCWLLWLAVISLLAVPEFRWWLQQEKWQRRVAFSFGFAFLLLGCLAMCASVKTSFLRPVARAGHELRRFLNGDGNRQVFEGKEGWLYPVAELDRLTQKHARGGKAEAVLQLQAKLKAASPRPPALLVLLVPDKLALYPEAVLPAKYEFPVLPPGHASRLAELRAAGVDVLDQTDRLWDERRRKPLYFAQDSHWTAEAMKELAVQTSRHIRKQYPAVIREETPLVDAAYLQREDVGDLARKLDGSFAEERWEKESDHMVGLRGLVADKQGPVFTMGGALMRVYDDPGLSFPPSGPLDPPAAWPTQLGALIGQGLSTADEDLPAEVLLLAAQGKKLIVWVVRSGEL